jgi:hypothetical protein
MDERVNHPSPWQVLAKRTIYSSEWITLQQWSVRLPDGSVIPDHHVLDFPRDAVASFCARLRKSSHGFRAVKRLEDFRSLSA